MLLTSKRITALLIALAMTSLMLPGTVMGGIKQLSAGVTLPQPLGTAAAVLNRPAGGAAQVWFEAPGFLTEHVQFNLSGEFLPYQFTNTNAGGEITLNLSMIGAYAGFTIWGGPSVLGMRPYISGDLGLLYDFLTIPNSGSSISNTGTAFAMRAAPGLDIPVAGPVGLMVELPFTIAFFNPALKIWQSTFSLRWQL